MRSGFSFLVFFRVFAVVNAPNTKSQIFLTMTARATHNTNGVCIVGAENDLLRDPVAT
jgi:hypothetical protein